MTPTGADLGKVTAEMVTVIDLDGEVVDGEFAPTSEVPLHTGIYAATNALAITHAHAMASTALSCTHDELPPLHYSCLGLGGAPRTAPTPPSDRRSWPTTSSRRSRAGTWR